MLHEAVSSPQNAVVSNQVFARPVFGFVESASLSMRWRAEVNKLQGVDSEVIGPAEVKRLVPYLDVSAGAPHPVLGALYHPPGGIIRHDAVVWGYARGADARGVHIHQGTEVTGIEVREGAVRGVLASCGRIGAPGGLNCTAGGAGRTTGCSSCGTRSSPTP